MNCTDVEARLQAYVDGELTVGEIAAVEVHCLECRHCADRVGAEREFRVLLRRQPREAAPAELRARI
ncbi:MAG: anti-sigma factor family protein [Candidatus Rokuibacteriota bacterium]